MRSTSWLLVCLALVATVLAKHHDHPSQDIDKYDQPDNLPPYAPHADRRTYLSRKEAKRQGWFKDAYNKVKPYVAPAVGLGVGAYKVYSNGKTIYDMVKSRRLRVKETEAEDQQASSEVAPLRRNHRRKKNKHLSRNNRVGSKYSARRQGWIKDAFNKAKKYAGPALSAGMTAHRGYNMVKSRRLGLKDAEATNDESEESPTMRRHRVRRNKNKRLNRKAKRQGWFKDAFEKVKPYAKPVFGFAGGVKDVYTNTKNIVDLAKGRKLRADKAAHLANAKA